MQNKDRDFKIDKFLVYSQTAFSHFALIRMININKQLN